MDKRTYGPQTAMVEALIDRVGRLTAREVRKIRIANEGHWWDIRATKASAASREARMAALEVVRAEAWNDSYDRSCQVESAMDVARNMDLNSEVRYRDYWAVRGAVMGAAEATVVLDLEGGRLDRDDIRALWAPMAAAIGWPQELANDGEQTWNWKEAE